MLDGLEIFREIALLRGGDECSLVLLMDFGRGRLLRSIFEVRDPEDLDFWLAAKFGAIVTHLKFIIN